MYRGWIRDDGDCIMKSQGAKECGVALRRSCACLRERGRPGHRALDHLSWLLVEKVEARVVDTVAEEEAAHVVAPALVEWVEEAAGRSLKVVVLVAVECLVVRQVVGDAEVLLA